MNLQMLPAVPTPKDFDLLLSLLAIIGDTKAAAARVEQLKAAAAQVHDAIAELKAEQAKLAAAREETAAASKALVDERAKQADHLRDAQARHEEQCQHKADRLRDQEAGLVNRERRLAADREAADALQADLTRRLEAIKAATA